MEKELSFQTHFEMKLLKINQEIDVFIHNLKRNLDVVWVNRRRPVRKVKRKLKGDQKGKDHEKKKLKDAIIIEVDVKTQKYHFLTERPQDW